MENAPIYIFSLLASSLCSTLCASFVSEAKLEDPLTGVAITELAWREVWQGERRFTFIRIVPPVLPTTSPSSVATPASPEPGLMQIGVDTVRAGKNQVNVSLMGAVYLGQTGAPAITEIRWPNPGSGAGSEVRAFVPVDLRHLQTFVELETADTLYTYTIFLSPCEVSSLSEDELCGERL